MQEKFGIGISDCRTQMDALSQRLDRRAGLFRLHNPVLVQKQRISRKE